MNLQLKNEFVNLKQFSQFKNFPTHSRFYNKTPSLSMSMFSVFFLATS